MAPVERDFVLALHRSFLAQGAASMLEPPLSGGRGYRPDLLVEYGDRRIAIEVKRGADTGSAERGMDSLLAQDYADAAVVIAIDGSSSRILTKTSRSGWTAYPDGDGVLDAAEQARESAGRVLQLA